MQIDTHTAMPRQLAFAPPLEEQRSPEAKPDPTDSAKEFKAFGDDGFTFFDFLDVINPLQHIPMVNTLYREITGDTIDPGSRIAGGTLFGGPIGAAVSVANVALEFNTGRDMGEHLFALLEDTPSDSEMTLSEMAFGDPGTVEDHVEVSRWAERETAYLASQAASLGMNVSQPVQMARAAPSPASQPDKAITNPSLADPRNPSSSVHALGAIQAAASGGAPTAGGGWFSDTMLTALSRYNDGQRLADMVALQKLPTE